MRTGAIILAGGASSRMGGPKPLLEWEGVSFAARLAKLYGEFCAPVVLVLGYHHERIRQQAGIPRSVAVTVNPAPERGMLSSLQCGLRALPAGLDGFLFTPCDYPAVRRETVAALIAAFQGGVCIPRHDGRNGHPVLCAQPLRAELLALAADASAKDVIRAHRHETVWVDVDDPGTVTDVDTPADYQNLLALAPAISR